MMRWALFFALTVLALAIGLTARHAGAADTGTVEIRPVAVDPEKGTITLTLEQLNLIIEMNNAAVDEAERLRAKTGCT